MENQRLIFFVVFAFSAFFLYQAWQQEKAPTVISSISTTTTTAAAANSEVPTVTPAPGMASGVPVSSSATTASATPETAARSVSGQTITVKTDTVLAEINTVGGDVNRLAFLQYHEAKDHEKDFLLFQQSPQHDYVVQTGLIGAGLPNHHTLYTAERTQYELAPDANTLTVRLVANVANAGSTGAVKVVKTLTFHRGSYLIDVGYEIENAGKSPLQADAYFQFLRDDSRPDGDSAMLPTFTGAAVYTDKDKFHKLPFKEIEEGKAKLPGKSDDGWIAMLQHYFLAAWLPAASVPREYYAKKLGNGLYSAGIIVPVGAIAPGQQATLSVPFYAGPQEQNKLAALAPGLNLTVDYGWLTIIATPLFWALQQIHRIVNNWGGAIIVLTVLLKLLFYPLSAAGYRSMAKMRAFAPRLQRLREQYGDDRQRLNMAMMALYKEEKINPLGGCFPILVQIPVFIALYWVLLASVELRQAPFILWIQDLSTPDPYYVLPVLMGATMLIQAWISPAPPDPVQAKIMKIMPVAFSVFFFFFPAGLVLYWLVNNTLSIAQQWRMNTLLGKPTGSANKKAANE